jgi:VIT1/CCC1 family predicted Fe2+/Mn2+ transporter
LPWFIAAGTPVIFISVLLSAFAALAIGGYLGYATTGHVVKSALRQLIVLIAAATVTYVIGRLFHANVS